MMWLPPDAPSANSAAPSRVATVGQMFDALIRMRGAMVVGQPGRGSK